MDEPSETPTIYTIGHSTRSIEEFLGLLREAGIACLVDVRTIPRSRANPQFNAESLAAELARAGIAYRHLRALGGLRGRRRGAVSPNAMWRNESFRNYADYAMTAAFRDGLDELLEIARGERCAIMCAEAVWWRCHRRIITDYLIAAGAAVFHIMAPGKIERARPTPGIVTESGGVLVYPAAAAPQACAAPRCWRARRSFSASVSRSA
jgi:uncharacterized protein (DUF488 family)